MSQYLVCEMQYARSSRMSCYISQILQYASQHASLAILTHNPLHTLCRSDINKAETDDRRLTEGQALQ